MASRNDAVSVDYLWEVFDSDRRKAWYRVESEPGTLEWNIAAGKIDVINNICRFVRKMNAAERSDSDIPVLQGFVARYLLKTEKGI